MLFISIKNNLKKLISKKNLPIPILIICYILFNIIKQIKLKLLKENVNRVLLNKNQYDKEKLINKNQYDKKELINKNQYAKKELVLSNEFDRKSLIRKNKSKIIFNLKSFDKSMIRQLCIKIIRDSIYQKKLLYEIQKQRSYNRILLCNYLKKGKILDEKKKISYPYLKSEENGDKIVEIIEEKNKTKIPALRSNILYSCLLLIIVYNGYRWLNPPKTD